MNTYPMAARYPRELMLYSLDGQLDVRLVESLQHLTRIEHECLAAQDAVSAVDLYALAVVQRTVAAVELMRFAGHWLPELARYDQQRRARFFETMDELIALAHERIASCLKGD